MTRGNGFKLKQNRLGIRKKFFIVEGGQALEHVVQRSSGCSFPGIVQSQAWWSSEQPGIMEGITAQGRGLELDYLLRSLPSHSVILSHSPWPSRNPVDHELSLLPKSLYYFSIGERNTDMVLSAMTYR